MSEEAPFIQIIDGIKYVRYDDANETIKDLQADNKALRKALDSIAYGNVLTGNGKRCHTWSFGDIRERAKQALKGESK